MRIGYAAASLYLAAQIPAILAAHFHLADKFVGHDFIDGFHWETFNDPTHGRTNYVDQEKALSSNLSFGTFVAPRLSRFSSFAHLISASLNGQIFYAPR
jgi:hypothetical protein